MRSEDTPECKRCGGDGFTSEHGCNPNYPESCAYTCPVQVQCEACEATGLEPPQDTSLDEPKACLCCNHVLAPLTNGLCFGCKEYLQTQQAKLLQVIEDEVMLVRCKDCDGQHLFEAVPLKVIKKLKDNVINGGSL